MLVRYRFQNPYANQKYDKNRIICINGQTIKIAQVLGEKIELYTNTGNIIWEAAFVLSNFISNLQLRGKRVVELGSGSALVGLFAAAYKASHTILTDTDTRQSQRNYKINSESLSGTVECVQLDWNKPKMVANDVDFIFGSDICYLPETFQGLIETIRLNSQPRRTVIYLCFKERFGGAEQRLFKMMEADPMFRVTEVVRDDFVEEFRDNLAYKIYRIHRI